MKVTECGTWSLGLLLQKPAVDEGNGSLLFKENINHYSVENQYCVRNEQQQYSIALKST